MMQVIHGVIGLLLQLLTLVGGISSLLVGYRKKKSVKSTAPPHQPWFVVGGALLAITLLVLGARLLFPKAAVALAAPVGSVDVTQPDPAKASVRFAVSGTSSNVPIDKCVYVLAKIASEWHVQECVQADETGSWLLPNAWIGDNSYPIVEGTSIQLMAVVANHGVEKDRKLTHPYQIGPDATSRPLRVVVRAVQVASVQASVD